MAQVQQASDSGALLNTVNSLVNEVNNRDVVQMFKDDTGTRRVLLGKGLNGFNGLKVSQTGIDVYDATDSQLVFNSDNNTFKIVASGTETVTKAASTVQGSLVVPHGLSFIPTLVAFVLVDSTSGLYVPVPTSFATLNGAAAGLVYAQYLAQVDATNITFYVNTPNYSAAANAAYTAAQTVPFKYYLLQETAN